MGTCGVGAEDDIAKCKNDAKKWISDRKSQTNNDGTGGEGNGAKEPDVKADIADRKKDAQKWISDWKDSTGGK